MLSAISRPVGKGKRMTTLTPELVYANLTRLEQGSITESARYRQQALELLADPQVSLKWRQAIAERLNEANHLLALTNVGSEDSY